VVGTSCRGAYGWIAVDLLCQPARAFWPAGQKWWLAGRCELTTPLVTLVPFEAATPVLVIVGFMMMTQVTNIDFKDPAIGIGAFLAIIMMPFTYSIANGIGFGLLAYAFVMLVTGRGRQVHPLLWLISVVFLIHFAEAPIYALIG
jgi:adenine/guanine/hypoxanthine permease